MRTLASCMAGVALLVVSAAAQKRLEVKDLPPAVQKTVQDQTKGAEIKGLSKETEKGVTSYEVETMVGGKHRDFIVNAKGVVGTSKISLVETMTRSGSTEKLYEASFTDKGGKKHAILVKANGTESKD